MIELPEAYCLSHQLAAQLTGKTVKDVIANSSPHKFAWYTGDPSEYGSRLRGRTVTGAAGFGGMAELYFGELRAVFCDGVSLRYYGADAKAPDKHQLYIEFEDGSRLLGTIRMYGALWLLDGGQAEGYNEIARQKPSPLSEEFDFEYFKSLYEEGDGKLSAKAYLATKQRIPGLGNGVLQDILFAARIHPKRRMETLSEEEYRLMFSVVRDKLREMVDLGGRDTESDIFGREGGYRTLMSSKSLPYPCVSCGGGIVKEAYMGGSVYYCPVCQRI